MAQRLGAQGRGAGATVACLAAEFDQYLAPSMRQPRTRADYWRAWCLVITWAVACKAVGDVFPMSIVTLEALTWDLVCFAVPTSQIEWSGRRCRLSIDSISSHRRCVRSRRGLVVVQDARAA